MSFLLGRDGRISTFRVSLLLAAVGIVFVLIGYLAFTLDQDSRRAPYEIALPNGATLFGVRPISRTAQQVYYTVPGDDADSIAQYYQERLNEFSGGGADGERCIRFPAIGNYPDYRPGTMQIPYQWKCMFDRSNFNATQYTEVTIHPGVPNPENPSRSTEGQTVIIYEQRWQP